MYADAHLLRRNLTGTRCKQTHIRQVVQCGETVFGDLSRAYFVAALHSVAFASRDTSRRTLWNNSWFFNHEN